MGVRADARSPYGDLEGRWLLVPSLLDTRAYGLKESNYSRAASRSVAVGRASLPPFYILALALGEGNYSRAAYAALESVVGKT